MAKPSLYPGGEGSRRAAEARGACRQSGALLTFVPRVLHLLRCRTLTVRSATV